MIRFSREIEFVLLYYIFEFVKHVLHLKLIICMQNCLLKSSLLLYVLFWRFKNNPPSPRVNLWFQFSFDLVSVFYLIDLKDKNNQVLSLKYFIVET